MTMPFEVDIEPVCIMVICLGGCAVIGHLALYARQVNPSVTLCLITVIAVILFFCCMLLAGESFLVLSPSMREAMR
jgi:hypothetical protein